MESWGFKMTDSLSEAIFRENEQAANIYTAKCMRWAAIFSAVIWGLNAIDFFIVSKNLMNVAMPFGIVLFLFPTLAISRWKERPFCKYVVILFATLGITVISSMLTYHSLLAWTLLLMLSCHYYSKRFTAEVFIISIICMAVALYIGLYVGVWDSNMMSQLQAQATERIITPSILKRVTSFYLLPRILILSALFPICLTVAGRTRQLLEKQREVTEEKERIGAELQVASRIQSDMLPKIFPAFPQYNEFDLNATMMPAKEVGGDFYDFFLIDDDHLALIIADVSGKGVPAALFMVISKTLLKNCAQTGLSPKEVLEKVNDLLCENNQSEMFVTVFLAVMEISTGKLTYASAGHEYPAIKRGGGNFELIQQKPSFVLAGMEGTRYREHTVTMAKDDILYLYTDGVAEATNANDELFGTQRMLEALNHHGSEHVDTLLQSVKKEIDEFVGDAPQFDDITMLAIEIKTDLLGR